MVDVVANHNGWTGDSKSVDYSQYNPFNSEEYYHKPCEISNYEDQTQIEQCWLITSAAALPDLKTEDQRVSDMYNTWITGLVSNYSGRRNMNSHMTWFGQAIDPITVRI